MRLDLGYLKKKMMKTSKRNIDKILAITKDADYLDNPSKQAQVKEYEKQINQMVYKLYGLTEEEIRIVEGKTK